MGGNSSGGGGAIVGGGGNSGAERAEASALSAVSAQTVLETYTYDVKGGS